MVCTKFTPNLYRVYIPTSVFPGEVPWLENCKLFSNFLHTLCKQREVYLFQFTLSKLFKPCVNHQAYITLGFLIAFPRIQTDRIHQLTRFPAMRTFRKALSGSILVRGGPKFSPKSKGWTVHVNHGWTMYKPKCMVYMEKCSTWLGRAQPVCNRLCQIWLHHVFTSPLEGLEPTCQV